MAKLLIRTRILILRFTLASSHVEEVTLPRAGLVADYLMAGYSCHTGVVLNEAVCELEVYRNEPREIVSTDGDHSGLARPELNFGALTQAIAHSKVLREWTSWHSEKTQGVLME